jgi:DNA-binding helix-hairpin-helix protein with protein kinase domain
MMSGILVPGDDIRTESSGVRCEVERLLGAGGQGEVYRVAVQGSPMALKWYYEHTATESQRSTLRSLIDAGAPDARFLWPAELAAIPSRPGFGYLMPLREPRYKGVSDLMTRRVSPSFRCLATAGVHLADAFLQLHARGLCYRDISYGNVFFEPATGDVLICDNDNVGPNRTEGGILGTPRFMAPEVVRGKVHPSTQTDLFSLAVLLFLMLMNHHPLEGKKEASIHCFDLPAMTKLYGSEPVFIFDPVDRSNEPVAGFHDNALVFWPLYPSFLKSLFTQSFTAGIREPDHGRVRESTWRAAMSRLRDAIFYCGCGAENFYDGDALKASDGRTGVCWKCGRPLRLPPRIRIGRAVVMLSHDAKLYAHHLDDAAPFRFDKPVAEVTQHPSDPTRWGLKNLTGERWTATGADGAIRDVDPGRNVLLAVGTKIHFGKADGEINLRQLLRLAISYS